MVMFRIVDKGEKSSKRDDLHALSNTVGMFHFWVKGKPQQITGIRSMDHAKGSKYIRHSNNQRYCTMLFVPRARTNLHNYSCTFVRY